uniref:M1 family aminopeptidase n=2 Tax=Roseivirga sp. TaxID=1964215 RepID=UPI004047EAAC
MIIDLLKFELFYQRKQRALIGLSIIFMFYGFMIGQQNFAPANVNFNSAHQVAHFTAFMSLGTVFILMFFAISGVIRDLKFKMESIIFTTSVSKYQFFVSRFFGVFIFGLLAFSPFFIGHWMGTQSPALDPERLSEFSLLSYLWPWLIFIVPNTLIMSAILFSIALLTKSNIATYVGATCVYVLYMISSIALNSPLMAQSIPPSEGGMMIAALLDPFGIAAFFEQTQYWTPYEKNTELLSLSGFLLANRLIWMAFAFVVLMLSYKFFSFKMTNQKLKKERKEKKSLKKDDTQLLYRPVEVQLNARAKRTTFVALIAADMKAAFKSLPFWVMILVWLFVVISEFVTRIPGGGEYRDSVYATSNILISYFEQPLELFSLLLIVFYSAELANRSRDFKMDGILDATPVSNIALFMSKWVSLLLLPVILISSAILLSVGFQISRGFFEFNWPLYLSLFYFNGAALIFYSLFALFIQAVIPNKYLGMGLTALAVVLLNFAGPFIGIQHPLLRLGRIALPLYTEMNGFAQTFNEFAHLAIYWFSLGGILALIAFKLFKRGADNSFKVQYHKLISTWDKGQRLGLCFLVTLFLGVAGLIFYNTNVLTEYRTQGQFFDIQEAYERKFKQFEDMETLSRTAMKTNLDLYPSDQRYDLRAEYILKNESSESISKMLIQEHEKLALLQLSGADLKEYDEFTGTYLFEFEQPVLPGGQVTMNYEINKRKKGYETDNAIVRNGTYLSFNDFEPTFGYSGGREISNNFEREKRGLPSKQSEVSTEEHLEVYNTKLTKVLFETVVSTEANQTAISSGNLVREWTKDNRNYFHYKTELPVLPTIAYFSADFETRRRAHKGISVEQYFHAANDYNIDRIMESAVFTLDYCSEKFGLYPLDHIRIAQVPAHWSFGGFAHPGLISMTEQRLYLADVSDSNSFDIVAKRTIHEVAHQWWGHILSPNRGEGGSFFIEGLAKYTEAVIMEEMYGKSAVWSLAENANRKYFQSRSYLSSAEVPLMRQEGDAYLAYGKNLTVLLALEELIGKDTINQVLKTIIDGQLQNNEYPVTVNNFLDQLYEVTPVEYHTLIDDWFKRIITYDLSIERAASKRLNNGQFEVTVVVDAARFRMLQDGSTEAITIDEPISIGLFTSDPKNVKNPKSVIYLEPHQINQAKMEFKFIVDELPTYASIDPYGTRSDENFFDNTIRVEK